MDLLDDNKIPDRCPKCKAVKKNILLHIRQKEECNSIVSSALMNKWRKLAYKKKKSKYQQKYIKTGKHKKHQAAYIKKLNQEDKESVLKIQRKKFAKYYQKVHFKKKKRFPSFDLLCRNILFHLKRGKCPSEKVLNKFHLVEAELSKKWIEKGTGKLFDSDVVHKWIKIKNVKFTLMSSVICFQNLALVPKSHWLSAIEHVKAKGKKNLKEKLFRLIGKLQAYNHDTTEDLAIPEEYRSPCKATMENVRDRGPFPETLTDEAEALLIELLNDIIGSEALDVEMHKILRLTNDFEVLLKALRHTIRPRWDVLNDALSKLK